MVVAKFKVFVGEGEEVFDRRVEVHGGEGEGCAGELELGLGKVVQIEVGVAQGVDKFARLQIAHLRHHHRQQGVGSDVEGHAQKNIRRTLIELAGQATLGDIKLKKEVAGGERHPVNFAHIPRIDNHPARVGGRLNLLDHLADLINHPTIRRVPGPPLCPVHGAKFTIFVRPLVPDADAVFLQVTHVGFPMQKPDQFVNDGFEMELFGGDDGKSILEIKAHLMPKNGKGAGPRSIPLLHPMIENMLK